MVTVRDMMIRLLDCEMEGEIICRQNGNRIYDIEIIVVEGKHHQGLGCLFG